MDSFLANIQAPGEHTRGGTEEGSASETSSPFIDHQFPHPPDRSAAPDPSPQFAYATRRRRCPVSHAVYGGRHRRPMAPQGAPDGPRSSTLVVSSLTAPGSMASSSLRRVAGRAPWSRKSSRNSRLNTTSRPSIGPNGSPRPHEAQHRRVSRRPVRHPESEPLDVHTPSPRRRDGGPRRQQAPDSRSEPVVRHRPASAGATRGLRGGRK